MLPLLNLLAAIALLVWGTHIVRTGMLRVFGENLRRILATSFSNRFRALDAGLGVTGIVQSSTATCLIVASFVGKNLVTTSAALAVMLGADVGTSVMAVVFSFDLSWLSPLLIFGWAVFAKRIESANVSGPLLLTIGGLVLANSSWGIVSVDLQSSTVHLLAELTLALLLFADASRVPLAAARHDLPLTGRLLGIGLPLSIVAGTVIALLLFPSLPFALAALMAASLAPTDAALSASVIADERLPMGVHSPA